MIKIWLFFHYELPIVNTSYKVNSTIELIEEKLLYNESKKIIGIFPDLQNLYQDDDTKIINTFSENKILISTRNILISNHNIYFKFDSDFIRNNFEISGMNELCNIEGSVGAFSDSIKPEYVIDFLNNLSINQKMALFSSFFYTKEIYLKTKIELFFNMTSAPDMKREINIFSFVEHQKRGLVFLNKNHRTERVTCFNYGMGAGKTRMIIYFLYGMMNSKIAIFLKSSLIMGILKEMQDIGIRNKLQFHIITNKEELDEYNGENCIISYEFLSRYKGNFSEKLWYLQFDYAVCDESQILENPSSNVFKNFINISMMRIALFSGTLLRNEAINSYYISYLLKLFTKSYEKYIEEIQANFNNKKTHALNKDSDFAVAIRRKILDITVSYVNEFKFTIEEFFLPIKLKKIEMESYQEELDEAYKIVKDLESEKNEFKKTDVYSIRKHKIHEILAKIPRMVALASNYKLKDTLYVPSKNAIVFEGEVPSKYLVLKSILQKHRFDKVLIFCSTKNVGISYSEMLMRDNIKNYYVDGGIEKNERFKLIEEFNNPKNQKNVFISIREALKYGFNFKNTSVIVNLDSSWTPADNEQANARIKRLSQVNASVVIYNLFSIATIDEYMKNTVRFKNNALKDFWSENSDYSVSTDYSNNYLSLIQLITALKEGNMLSKVKEIPVSVTESIEYSEISNFFVKVAPVD